MVGLGPCAACAHSNDLAVALDNFPRTARLNGDFIAFGVRVGPGAIHIHLGFGRRSTVVTLRGRIVPAGSGLILISITIHRAASSISSSPITLGRGGDMGGICRRVRGCRRFRSRTMC